MTEDEKIAEETETAEATKAEQQKPEADELNDEQLEAVSGGVKNPNYKPLHGGG